MIDKKSPIKLINNASIRFWLFYSDSQQYYTLLKHLIIAEKWLLNFGNILSLREKHSNERKFSKEILLVFNKFEFQKRYYF